MYEIFTLSSPGHVWRRYSKQLIMFKLMLLMSLIFTFSASASYVLAQKADLKVENKSLKEVFRLLKEQTDVDFLYTESQLKKAKLVSLDLTQKELREILELCFKEQALTYSFKDNTVLVKHSSKFKVEANPLYFKNEILQQRTITGQVTDENRIGLVGVSVYVKGTNQGTSTNSEGRYTISLNDRNAVLVFSFVGFISQEVPVGNNNTVNVTLQEDVGDLDEVVVVGYGTQKKINLTGAVDVVSGEELVNRPAPNVSLLLQGTSPNLNISLNAFGGEPGATQKIQIRGVGSLNSNTSPLVLVDGVETNIDFIDPETVESVSVLKDASASAVYGSRAAFGVILITTKKGGLNQPIQLGYSNNSSFNVPIYVPSMESSLIYATAFNQAAINAGVTPTFPDEQVERIKKYIDGTYLTEYNPDKPPTSQWRGRWEGNANYNWTEEYYKKHVFQQKHNLNVSGGDNKSQYYLNAGFYDQPGSYSWGDDGYKRYNVMANVNTKINDWASVNFSTKYARTETDNPLGMVGLERTYTWSQFINFWPTMPKYNIDGTIANPLMLVLDEGGRIKNEKHDLWMNIGAEIEPVKGWKTNFSYNYNTRWADEARNPKPVPVPIPNGTVGNIGEASTGYISKLSKGQYDLLSVYSSYENQIQSHYFKGLIGYEQDVNFNKGLSGSKMDLITENVPSISTALGDYTLSDFINHWATQGVFGRINYNYNEKYLLELSARYDGSSRFAQGSRWGFFPSFSVGYNISREDFWQPIENYVNNLKVRFSYGSLGNQNVANYLYLSTIPIAYSRNPDNYSNPGYILDGEVPLYARIPGMISPDLTWETITSANFGLDADFLNNRLNLTADFYNRTTSNMIGPVAQVPSLLGATLPHSNNAELSTKGFELSIGWKETLSQDFSYNFSLNLSDYKTKITKYFNESGRIADWYEGRMHGDIWGLTTDGIIQTAGEQMPDQSFIYPSWGPGDIKYKDLNGDGKIDEGSRTLDDHGDLSVIANTTPRYAYGFMAGATWKNIDVNMFWQGVMKRDFLPNTTSEYFWGIMQAPNSSGVFKGGKMLDYWRPADETNLLGPNTNSYFPKTYFSAERNKNIRDQSRYVMNASYIRLKNLQVGYTISPAFLDRISVRRARIYVSGENILTFSKLPKMYEPETVVSSTPRGDGINTSGGIDMGEIYPISAMFSFGLNLSF